MIRCALALPLALTVLSVRLPAQEQDPARAVAAIKQAVAETIRKGTPAVMLAVVKDGKVLLTHTEGRVGKKRQATAATLFPMGGTSRAIANLVLARLHAAGQPDARTGINKILTPLVLREFDGRPVDASLLDLLRGDSRLPEYENFLQQIDISKWPLRRAIAENAFVIEGRHSGNLAYGIAQHAAEAATKKSWTALVNREVLRPLGLENLIPDARMGLPTTATTLYRKGLLGLSVKEKRSYSDIAAAHGAWIDAADLAKVLLELLRACGDATSNSDLAKLRDTKLEFANFGIRGWSIPVANLRLEDGMPGMHGGIYLVPELSTAWAVYANSSKIQNSGVPHKVLGALCDVLLPAPRKTDKWNTAVGLGGGVGGRFASRFTAKLQGEWIAEMKVHGKRVPLRMWIGAKRVMRVQFGEHAAVLARSTKMGDRVNVRAGDILRLRKDTSLETRLDLRVDGEKLTGTLRVDGKYCHMEFRVAFSKVEPK